MIKITWITDLINNMPLIISYIVYGYVFLTAYYWISFKDNNDFNNLIIKSVATSFILKSMYELIENIFYISFSSEILQIVIQVCISCGLGFVIGKITSHRLFNLFLHKLHIGRTTNQNIWDDVIKPYTWVRVFMKDGSSYLGQYRYGEPYKSEPIIALATYQKLNKDSDIVINNSNKMNELILINTKDFDRIEITYTDGPMSKPHFNKIFNLMHEHKSKLKPENKLSNK